MPGRYGTASCLPLGITAVRAGDDENKSERSDDIGFHRRLADTWFERRSINGATAANHYARGRVRDAMTCRYGSPPLYSAPIHRCRVAAAALAIKPQVQQPGTKSSRRHQGGRAPEDGSKSLSIWRSPDPGRYRRPPPDAGGYLLPGAAGGGGIGGGIGYP